MDTAFMERLDWLVAVTVLQQRVWVYPEASYPLQHVPAHAVLVNAADDPEIIGQVPAYSTDLTLAWHVMERAFPEANVGLHYVPRTYVRAQVVFYADKGRPDLHAFANADQPAAALCLVALWSVGVEIQAVAEDLPENHLMD